MTPLRGETVAVRPRYSAADVLGLLARQGLIMFLVFAVVLAIGAVAALALPKTYTAHSSLIVRLSQDYVYQPRAGDAGRGATPQKDQVVQSEAEILGSDELKRRVIAQLGLKTVDPKLALAWEGASGAKRHDIEGAAMKEMRQGLSVSTTPDSNVIRLDFKSTNPDSAATILNALIQTYLSYRKEVFVDVAAPALANEKAAFQDRLKAADDAYEGFLKHNGVADFTTEKAALAATYQSIFDENVKSNVQVREIEGQLANLKVGMQSEAPEIEIQRDLDLSAQTDLMKLRAERQDLLARYVPTAQPVRDLDAKIASLESLIAAGKAVGEKDKRLGVNTVRQGLENQRINLEAQLAAMQNRRDELGRQLAQVAARQTRLTGLESEYQNLSVQRDVLQANVKDFTVKQEENRASADLSKASNDDIRVIERASPPVEATSLRKVVFGLALVFALFSAVCAGLLRVFTARGFPTPESAGRTLDLPVLATAHYKA